MKMTKVFGGLAVGFLLTLAIVGLREPVKADTQLMQTGYLLPLKGDLLNGNMFQIPLNSNTNIALGGNAGIVAIKPGAGIALYPYFIVTNTVGTGLSTVSNVTFTFATSPWTNSANAEVASTPVGTTNFTTITNNLVYSVSQNGNTAVLGYMWIPWTNIAGSRFTLISAATTATNVGGINVSNIWWEQFAPQ